MSGLKDKATEPGGAATEPALAAARCTVPSGSAYIPVHDGVRLAADLWFPASVAKLAALVVFTRYWRGYAAPEARIATNLQPIVRHFNGAGYAVVIVDVRGTGASFGHRDAEWSHAEVSDFGPVFDWICRQPWSNERIATIGISYGGNTAELAALTRHRALRAVVPKFSDFTEYQHAFFPGGVRNITIADRWVDFVMPLDANDPEGVISSRGSHANPDWRHGVRPVEGDVEALARAVHEHGRNANLREAMARIRHADDPCGAEDHPELTLESVSPSACLDRIIAARIPSMHWASWFDGGTADGVLTRFVNDPGPLHVVIGAWNHGGSADANPWAGDAGGIASPPLEQHYEAIQQFLDPLLKADEPSSPLRAVDYVTVGANRWRRSIVWPPEGSHLVPYFPAPDGRLEKTPPPHAIDEAYRVDPYASTGICNRWTTQLGARVDYGDRREADQHLLTFTSPPLHDFLELTGTPVLHARMRSDATDGALFAYLEAVAPDGRVTYLTDGVLRLRFPDADGTATPYHQLGVMPGFTRAEARDCVPGEWFTARFSLNPLSAELPAGYCIRLALAGADHGTFEPVPAAGPSPTFQFRLGGEIATILELPIVETTRKVTPIGAAP